MNILTNARVSKLKKTDCLNVLNLNMQPVMEGYWTTWILEFWGLET